MRVNLEKIDSFEGVIQDLIIKMVEEVVFTTGIPNLTALTTLMYYDVIVTEDVNNVKTKEVPDKAPYYTKPSTTINTINKDNSDGK